MERMASPQDMRTHDLYWLLDLNEAIDVFKDMNDLDCVPPGPIRDPNYKGTPFVKEGLI